MESAYRGMYSQAIVIVKDGTRMESEPAPDLRNQWLRNLLRRKQLHRCLLKESTKPGFFEASSQPAGIYPPQESNQVELTPSEVPPEGNTSSGTGELPKPEESSSTPEGSSSSSTDPSEGILKPKVPNHK